IDKWIQNRSNLLFFRNSSRMLELKSPNEKKPKSRSCNLKKVIAQHSRTKCCCCIPIKPGVMTIAILLLIHALWHTAIMIPEIK
ncbi:9466_t:CDS:2, partial [Entrophospora sp. SA101]